MSQTVGDLFPSGEYGVELSGIILNPMPNSICLSNDKIMKLNPSLGIHDEAPDSRPSHCDRNYLWCGGVFQRRDAVGELFKEGVGIHIDHQLRVPCLDQTEGVLSRFPIRNPVRREPWAAFAT